MIFFLLVDENDIVKDKRLRKKILEKCYRWRMVLKSTLVWDRYSNLYIWFYKT